MMEDPEDNPEVRKLLAWLREAEQHPGYVPKMKRLIALLDEMKVHRVSDLHEDQAYRVYEKLTTC